jgi:hypothetical protein
MNPTQEKGMKKRHLAIVLTAWLTWSCTSGPTVPPVLDPDGAALSYSLEQWKLDRDGYQRLMGEFQRGGDDQKRKLDAASAMRDRMVHRLRADIRSYHAEYEVALTESMRDWNIFGDLTQLGLALAATVTKGKETKTILSAVIAATAGAKLSVDKNYYREKTSEVLISSMRSARLEKDTAIVGKLSSLQADRYPLEEALCDLVDLYYAGMLTEAFQRLAAKAGDDAEQVSAKAEELDQRRAYLLSATEAQIQKRRAVTGAIFQLQGKQLDAMLDAMGVTPAADANDVSKQRALLERFKADTHGFDAVDPRWKLWEKALETAQKAGG